MKDATNCLQHGYLLSDESCTCKSMEEETLTPLQKAIELYEYYSEQLLIQHESAKLCAKKVCEEILNEKITDRQMEYWKWVMDEIINIHT